MSEISMNGTPTPICCNGLVKICGGNHEFAKSLLEKFKGMAPQQADEIQTAFDNNDLEKLRSVAHSLKGSSAMMGAVTISQVAGSIERNAREADTNSTQQLIEQLKLLVNACMGIRF